MSWNKETTKISIHIYLNNLLGYPFKVNSSKTKVINKDGETVLYLRESDNKASYTLRVSETIFKKTNENGHTIYDALYSFLNKFKFTDLEKLFAVSVIDTYLQERLSDIVIKPTKSKFHPDDLTTDLSGRLSCNTKEEFRHVVEMLESRGYSFIEKGKVFDKNLVDSNFYGIQWCKSEKDLLYFYTTKKTVFNSYR